MTENDWSSFKLCQAVSGGKLHIVRLRSGQEWMDEDSNDQYLVTSAICGRNGDWIQEIKAIGSVCTTCGKKVAAIIHAPFDAVLYLQHSLKED